MYIFKMIKYSVQLLLDSHPVISYNVIKQIWDNSFLRVASKVRYYVVSFSINMCTTFLLLSFR
jgi:hypothetical protein